jgi:8-oxo-dGTP pyrophosphatase MutT (NUDIX family)
MNNFFDIQALQVWLEQRRVALAEWGRGSSKSLGSLWAELQSGESELADNPPRRIVSVVQVIIRRGDHVLVEAAQEMEDGRQRRRRQLPAEKMHPGEEPEETARRGLQEELGVTAEDVRFVPGSVESWQWERDSISYPGLRTCYRFFRIEAAIAGLPEQPFNTRERTSGPGEPVQRHFWEWAPAGPVLERRS